MSAARDIFTLYAVTDRRWCGEQSLKDQVVAAIKGGVTTVQLREKNMSDEDLLVEALETKEVCNKNNVVFIVNDNVDVALKSEADGVHIGQNDMDVKEVKKLIPEKMLLGVSVTNLAEAMVAQEAGADYLGVGAVFPTKSKDDAKLVDPRTLHQICQSVKIPVVAIGGITSSNMFKLASTGIAGVAVISAIFSASDIESKSRSMFKLANKIFGQGAK
ncbi:MAG: thiamine phosphate synthase [Eggerthellaceae bacterium]|nr:thiamine phosphate synthase [Eggerthellaceae bacterium]